MSLSITDLVLVAVMSSPRDREIARLLGWYRIPLRSAPKVVAVDYLAFYQTSTFGEEKWQIQFVAPVHGHELATRAELLHEEIDHPHAHQEYYKIQVGPLERLSHPVLADNWKRITFLYTTGERLLQANTLKDLVVYSEERQLLWKTLRERAAQFQPYSENTLPPVDVDPHLLAALLGLQRLPEESI